MNGKIKHVFLLRIRCKMWRVEMITNAYFGFQISLIIEYKHLMIWVTVGSDIDLLFCLTLSFPE
jgi:hypothetical protein